MAAAERKPNNRASPGGKQANRPVGRLKCTPLIKVAVSFHAGWGYTMKNVVLPYALPMIFAGLRIAAGTALLLLVAAEMIAAEQGIGALILHYGDLMITERLMAGVIVLSVLGLIFNLFLQFLERKLVPWDHKE